MSPLFRRRSPEEREAEQAAAERAERSLALIGEGRIPLAAAERLRAFTADELGPGAFSSDLSVSEWSAVAGLGIVPLTQVMGSSIYHVGWQPTYYTVPTEVRVLSQAYNECRRLALGRMLEEASTCGADAVLGVRIERGSRDWAPDAIEFIALGTAVRMPEALRQPGGGTMLSDLTGQEFALLCRAGLRPVGIAAHTSVHYVPSSIRTMRAQSGWGGWVNQELIDFTRGVYEARERAMGFIEAQVRELGGEGVIGVSLQEHNRTFEVSRGAYETTDLEVTFHVMGTAVRSDPGLAESAMRPPLSVLRM